MKTRHAYVLGAIALMTSGWALSCYDDDDDARPVAARASALTFASLSHRGVTLSGPELGTMLPGTINVDYGYPTHAQVDYYVGKGATTLRLPFKWERVQRTAFGALDTNEVARLDDFVKYATSKGVYVILDLHNFGKYYNQDIGTSSVALNALADVWSKLANQYKTYWNVDFGLMNEPVSITEATWVNAANQAIQAIRNAGATNLILVSGVHWDNAANWNDTSTGSSNAVALLGINDSGNNTVFEAHQYFDDDGFGASFDCTSVSGASDRMASFTSWLRSNGRKGFLGAFGATTSSVCLDAIDNLTNYVQANADVYLGWTAFGGGQLPSDYPYILEPRNGQDSPQVTRLVTHWPAPPINGLQGSYYDNQDFTNLKLTRIDPTINFDWGTGSPSSSIGVDTFSVRWLGQVLPRYSQTYTFYATSDDGVRLWVNGQQIINAWRDRAATESSGTISLTAGRKVDLRYEYYENAGNAVAKLAWSSTSEPKAIIPQSALFAPATGGTGGTGGAGGAGGAGGRGGTGGTATGGVATGGIATGGIATGGIATGGIATGGIATGGIATGGVATGGVATGGIATGGIATGGIATGGIATGGVATGGVATGGVGTGGTRTGGTSGSLSANIVKQNDWGSGYCANVNVTNNGSSTTSSWTVVFDVGQATLNNSWNASLTTSGSRYTAKNLSYNGTLTSRATTQFGYCVNVTGASVTPTVISVGP